MKCPLILVTLFSAGVGLGQVGSVGGNLANPHAPHDLETSRENEVIVASKNSSIAWSGDAETDWREVVDEAANRNDSNRGGKGGSPGTVAASLIVQADGFLKTADDAAEFSKRYSGDPRAKEARSLEVSALFKSVMSGNDDVSPRAESVAAELIADTSLTVADRFTTALQLELVRQRTHFGDHASLKRERAASARRLILNGLEQKNWEPLFSFLATNPVPGAPMFKDSVQGGELTDATDRWNWVLNDMWYIYTGTPVHTQRAWASESIFELSKPRARTY